MSGERIISVPRDPDDEYLPVEYVLYTSDGAPAFRVVGLENVATLNSEMKRTQVVTITGFLFLALATLLLALGLFNRFMLSPLHRMAGHMRQMAQGKLDLAVNSKGLREFHLLADTFNGMADQVRMRTNDLERLLDLDDSAIVCFDADQEMVFFNRAAVSLFGYPDEEISDLDMPDLFTDAVDGLMRHQSGGDGQEECRLHTVLGCRHKDGHEFACDAVINTLDVMGRRGHAVALNTAVGDHSTLTSQNEQRLGAVEQSLTSLLDFARSNPSLLLGLSNLGDASTANMQAGGEKARLREQAVGIMSMALACWEHDLGKSKLALAEESGIWPVYIDKSTPTTRTLDKYLSLENCPKNPRSKRVVDTAEFVLRRVADPDSSACRQLQAALDEFRRSLSGLRSSAKGRTD
jgi:PAS domain S-box-containing protein